LHRHLCSGGAVKATAPAGASVSPAAVSASTVLALTAAGLTDAPAGLGADAGLATAWLLTAAAKGFAKQRQ
jgi:hypothetical protein